MNIYHVTGRNYAFYENIPQIDASNARLVDRQRKGWTFTHFMQPFDHSMLMHNGNNWKANNFTGLRYLPRIQSSNIPIHGSNISL
mmetsp:Transcript_67399/g.137217  ORF Transcript_67399/g.137217 Transcript_67399/m.137217 type:complete len:85 (+) Transcript_67399:1172-1426(+)